MTPADVSPSTLSAPLRAALYAGACVVLPPTPCSERLVCTLREVVEDAFGGALARAHEGRDVGGFFAALTCARARVAVDERVTALTLDVLEELGVDPYRYALDRPRLRGVAPGAHRAPVTRDAYALHRDIWYANPRAQLNLWIPLAAVTQRDGLSLYPDVLRTPLQNDSERFDYAEFRALGGFQSGVPSSSAAYPRLRGAREDEAGAMPAEPGARVGVPRVPAMPRAGRLLFSAAQLHGPTPHMEPSARFSVDVRMVSRLDQRLGRGAPRVDDRSRGDASADYTLFGDASLTRTRPLARGT